MNLLKLVPVWVRLAAVAALAITCIGFGFVKGSEHTQAKWDKDTYERGKALIAQQQTVITELTAQKKRGDTAEALNAKLKNDYAGLSGSLADSVRKYAAAKRAGALCGSVAAAGGNAGGQPDGHQDPESDELAQLTQQATDACLADYRQLKVIWAKAPPATQ